MFIMFCHLLIFFFKIRVFLKHLSGMSPECLTFLWERSGSVVECLTRDRGAAGSILTALLSLSKTHLS